MNIRPLYRPIILLVMFLAMAAAPVFAKVPPKAKGAMDKGIAAANRGEFPLAIQHFQAARAIAPDAADIYYNLGLAESKMPGRELRAIAWFGAFLAANPETPTPTVAAIREEIDVLDFRSRSNISRLIKSVQDAASQISNDENRLDVALMLAKVRDIVGAQKTTDLIQDASYKSAAQALIAEAQAKTGDIAGARKTADLIRTLFYKSDAQKAIALAQARSGDITGAQKTFIEAKKTVDLSQSASFKGKRQADIAEAQAYSGDIAGAQKTFIEAKKTADLIQDAVNKSDAQEAIALAQARSGDIAGAQKTADIIQDAQTKSRAQIMITAVQAKVDITGLVLPMAPNSTRKLTSDTQAPMQPAIAVTDWLQKLDNSRETNNMAVSDRTDLCPLNTDLFLDLAGYLRSLPSPDDPKTVFKGLLKTAFRIVEAQYVITEMLKQQAKQ